MISVTKLRGSILAAVLIALSACSGGGEPPPPPPSQPRPPDIGGFTPNREHPVGFPAMWQGGSRHDRRVASEEVARVTAMHDRGGTGAGETVGVFDLGANPEHPDLAGQYAARCAMGLCNGSMGSADDGRPRLDRRDHSPLNDADGHGTVVHGVVAASRNGVGIYGVAYEARIASYGVEGRVPWDDGTCVDCGVGPLQHAWGGIFDRQIARGMDWMRSLGAGATNMSWGRTYPWSLDRKLTRDYVGRIMPHTLPAFKAYVEAGGVVVWGAGNSRSVNPDVEASLPRHFPELEKGWLAVVGLAPDGRIAGYYSSLCGIAADWCIAAPGDVLTTRRNGRWDFTGGTSIAAPYVTAGLAALKSMFPNLSYHDVRERVLATADKSSDYGRREIYGQGRLDLDAASRPIGGTNFALGALDRGAVAPTDRARVVLPREAIAQYLGGRTIVVLDGFQRAPFEVGLDVFAEAHGPYLSIDDLGLDPHRRSYSERGGLATVAAAGYGSRAGGLAIGRSFVGVGQGRGVVQGLARLGGTGLPVSGYRMSTDATGMALGYSGGVGRWQAVAARGARERDVGGVGISGWNPETVLAASFSPRSPNRAVEAPGTDTFGVAFASELHRPMGWRGSGAFRLRGDSFELAWRRNIMACDTVRVDVTNRLTHLEVRGGPLLRLDDAQLASVDLDVSFRLHRSVTVEARLGAERPVSSVSGRIRAAAGVDQSGRIAYRDVTFGGRDLLKFDRASLIVRMAAGSNASVALGVTAVRDGFGQTETLAGMRMDFEL